MSDPKKVYVVMRRSGAVMKQGGSLSPDTASSGGPYLVILDAIASEMSSAAGDYDTPHQLYLNGKCVVDGGLADLAWKYSRDKVAARDAALRAVQNIHMPGWLPDDEGKPGYNPPGVDEWTVEKRAKP